MAIIQDPNAQVSPITGLPTQNDYNKFVKSAQGRLTETGNAVGTQSMTPDDINMFGKYGVNYNPELDNEERRAELQGTGEKWANGIIKFGGKTLTATAGGILGPVVGIPAAIANGSFNSFFDNDYQRWLDSMNESMDKNLPNYKTHEEEKANFFKSMGTANFWADDFLGAMSFTAGAILTEMAYAPAAALLGEAFSMKMMNNLQKSARAKETLKALDVASNINAVRQGTNITRQLITGAGYEAGVEARQFKDQARETAISNFQQSHGKAPNDQELAEIEDHINNTANAVFGANMAIVGLSNFLQYPKIFGAGTKAEIGLFGKTGLIGESGAFKGAYTEAKGLTKGLYTAAKYLEKPAEEGLWEEGMQNVTQNAAKNYITDMYSPDGLNNQRDMFDSLGDAFAESYGTKEGWKSIGMGMLIGALGSPSFRYNKAEGLGSVWAGGVFDTHNEIKNTQKNIDDLATRNNNFNINQIYEQAKQNRAISEASKRYDHAVENGDVAGAKSAEHDVLFAMTAARHEAGMAGNFKEELGNHIDNLTEEQFADTYGYNNKTKKELAKRKAEVKESTLKKVDQHIKAIDKAKELIPSEDSQDETRKNIQLGLAYTMSGIEDVDAREDAISTFISLNVAGVDTRDIKKVNNLKRSVDMRGEFLKSYKRELGALKGLKTKHDNLTSQLDALSPEHEAKRDSINERIKEKKALIKQKEKELKAVEKKFNKTKPGDAEYDYEDVNSFRSDVEKLIEINDLKEKAKLANPLAKQDIEDAFKDLDNLATRRQDLIESYNNLFTKKGQKEVDTLTKEQLKSLQAFGIHSLSPESNEKASTEQMLNYLGKSIGTGIKAQTNEELPVTNADVEIDQAIDELGKKIDDESNKLLKEVSDAIKNSKGIIPSEDLLKYLETLKIYRSKLEQDKNKYTDEDTQLHYENILSTIETEITNTKVKIDELNKQKKQAQNSPNDSTIKNPNQLFELFQDFIPEEVKGMVSALNKEDLKGKLFIKVEDYDTSGPIKEKVPGSGVYIKKGLRTKEGKGVYLYLNTATGPVRIGGLFDPRRFSHADGKEMNISENNPAILGLINSEFVTPNGQITEVGKKFVRYYKSLKNFYEETLDKKDELTPEETDKLFDIQVTTAMFVKYADQGMPYSERPKISEKFNDPKWYVEIPGVFKGLIVFNRLKLDGEYSTGNYIFVKKEGGQWEKADDALRSKIQSFIGEKSSEGLRIGWNSMSQYGLLINTTDSKKSLRVIDIGLPTVTIDDKNGFMINLSNQLKELVERINDPEYDKEGAFKTVTDDKGNEYFIPLLTGKNKGEGALKTQLGISTFKDGNVAITLEIYHNDKRYNIRVGKVFGKQLTVDNFKDLTYDKLVNQLQSFLLWNQTDIKGSLVNTPIAKFELSLNTDEAFRRVPDVEGNEHLFENMIANSDVPYGEHYVKVVPKDVNSPKYDLNNPPVVNSNTSTKKDITTQQKHILDNAVSKDLSLIDLINVFNDLKNVNHDTDSAEKLKQLSDKIVKLREELQKGFTQGEEDSTNSTDELQDYQQQRKDLLEENRLLERRISKNVADKSEIVKLAENKAKIKSLEVEIVKLQAAQAKDDEEEPPFSLSESPTSDRMEYEQALATLKRILPSWISVGDVDTLIRNIQNKGETWGSFMDKVVYLNKQKAGRGTEYHEAFHAVFRLLLTNSQIERYYDLASKRYGTPKILQLQELKRSSSAYRRMSNQDLRKLWYEEQMAEDFKKYANTKESEVKSTGIVGWLKELFDKIVNMFNAVSDNRDELDTLFSNIYSGNFKNATEKYNVFSKKNKPVFSLLKSSDPFSEGLDPISQLSRNKSARIIYTVAAKLFTDVIEKKGKYSDSDIFNIINKLKERYTLDNFENEINTLEASRGEKAAIEAEDKILEVQRALDREDNIAIIKEDVQKIIKEMYSVDQLEEWEESKNEQEKGRNEFEERSMSNVGGMNSLSKKMKQYMNMTMLQVDEFGLGLTPEQLNQEKYQVAVNGTELYQGLERLLANTNKTNLFEKLYQYKSSNANADAFYGKLIQDISNDIKLSQEEVENMVRSLSTIDDQTILEQVYATLSNSPAFNTFITSFTKNKVKYFKVLYDADSGQIKGINANDKDVDIVQFEKWKQNFKGKQLTKIKVDSILKNIQSKLLGYSFDTKKETLNDVVNTIKLQFGELGIDLSFGFIKYSVISQDTIQKQLADAQSKGNELAKELISFQEMFNEVEPLQTYEEEDGTKVNALDLLIEKNASSHLRSQTDSGESTIVGFFAKNLDDNGRAVDTSGAETRLKQLASNNAIFDESVGDSTFQNAENKTIFDKVFPSYLTQAITSLKEDILTQEDLDSILSLKEYYRANGTILSDYQARTLLQVLGTNPLIKGWQYDAKSGFTQNPEIFKFVMNNMQIFIMDGLKQEKLEGFSPIQQEGKTYKDLDKRSKALMMLSMFADKTQTFSRRTMEGFNPEGTRLFILGTNEAKSTTVGVNLPVQNFYANGNITELGLKYFNSTFEQEYGRIQKVVEEIYQHHLAINKEEELYNYSHSYHGELDFIKFIKFDDNGNIINWKDIVKEDDKRKKNNKNFIPRGLQFFQLSKLDDADKFAKQAVEGKKLPNVNSELQEFGNKQLSDFLDMLSGSDVDILSKSQGNGKVGITSENYTREKVKQDSNTAYVFTENTHSITAFPNRTGGGSAIIRGLNNAFAIVTKKKYDYNTRENVDYKDTDSDFKEFKEINTKLINQLKNSGKDKIVFPQGFGTDKAKMPTRFAEWLQKELLDNFGLVTELNSTKTGLNSKSIKGESSDKTTYTAKQLPKYYNMESSSDVDVNKLGQYFFNHYFNNMAFNPFIHGDLALNYKNSVDVVKRNGGLIAFGPDMGLGISNYAVVEDEEMILDDINSNKKKVDRTDAQTFGHVNWYIDTYLKGMGKFNQGVAPILEKIRLGLDLIEPLSSEELKTLEDNNATLQPRKIVQRDMFTYLKTSLHTLTRAQVSYIDPEYLKSNGKDTVIKRIKKYTEERNFNELDKIFKPLPGKEKLHDLYNQMERQDLGFTIFHSGSKMTNLNVGKHDGTKWILPKQFVNNNTIREQVSTDGFKEEIVHGTQLMNLIWSEQDLKATAAFMGQNSKVSKLVEMYKGLLKYRVKTGTIDLKNTIFEIAPDGKLTKAKWGELLESFQKSLNTSGSDPYLLELFVDRGDGSPKYNPNFGFIQAKYEAMYLAYVSKASLAQKTAGRKYTLVSDYGNEVMREPSNFLNDNIIWGHPTIGKSFLKQKGNTNFITLDDDYADEVNSFIDAHRGKKTRQEYKGSKPKEYNEFMLSLFDRLKKQAKKEDKKLFVSNTNILKERASDFDRVINMSVKEFKRRLEQRGSLKSYDFNDWKSDIDKTIAGISEDKIITTDKYLSELFEGNKVIRTDQFRANPDKYKGFQTSRLKHRVSDGKGGYYSECIVSEKAARVHNLKAGDAIPEELAKQFGIRIPTQDDHSMVNLKIVDVIPGYYGNAITVPVEIIKLSGADFDIDSLYARMYNAFKNQFKGSQWHTHGDYLKADSIDSAEEMAFDEYLNRISKLPEVKEKIKELQDSDIEYVPIQMALRDIENELESPKHEWQVIKNAVNAKIEEINYLFNQDKEEDDPTSNLVIKEMDNKFARNLKLDTAKILIQVSKNIYKPDIKLLEQHLNKLQTLLEETNRRIQFQAIEETGYANNKPKFLEASSLNKNGELKNNKTLISGNIRAFTNGDLNEINPLSKNEADNLLLSAEMGLLHNSSEDKKKIGFTPSSMDNFSDLRNEFEKIGIPSADNTTGVNSPLDILLSATANDVGKKGIGPAALFNVIFQKLNESKVHLSENMLSELRAGFDKFNTFGNFNNKDGKRINDIISSVISAMTDNAKERYAATFNLTTDTLGPALTMLGLGVPFNTVMMFMKQPIIVEMSNWYTMANSPVKPQITTKEEGSIFIRKDANIIREHALKILDIKEPEKLPKLDLNKNSGELLKEALIKGYTADSKLTKEQFDNIQLLVADLFVNYKNMSDTLINLSAISGLTKGLDSTWVEAKGTDQALERLGYKIQSKTLDGPNSYSLNKMEIDPEKEVFMNMQDVLNKQDVLTNLQTYGFIRDSAKFYFILQSPEAIKISNHIKSNFRDSHFNYDDNRVALERGLISGLTMIAYRNTLSKLSKNKKFLFDFDVLLSDSASVDSKLASLITLARNTERYRENPLLNFLTVKKIDFEKGALAGKTLNKVEGNTRSEKNYDYLESLMDGYKQIAMDAMGKSDLSDGVSLNDIKALNKYLVQYIISKDALMFKKGSYIKNLTPSVLKRPSDSLDDIQELFAGTSNKTFEQVFGDSRENIINELEELYSRGNDTYYGIRGTKEKLLKIALGKGAEQNEIVKGEKKNPLNYTLFMNHETGIFSMDVYAGKYGISNKDERFKHIAKNAEILRNSELASSPENNDAQTLFSKFIQLDKENNVPEIYKIKSVKVDIDNYATNPKSGEDNRIILDINGNMLNGKHKGKNLLKISPETYKSVFTDKGIRATQVEYEPTLGIIGHKEVQPWAFTVEQWDNLLGQRDEKKMVQSTIDDFKPLQEDEIGFNEDDSLMARIKRQHDQAIKNQSQPQVQNTGKNVETKEDLSLLEKLKRQHAEATKNSNSINTDNDELTLSTFSDTRKATKEEAEVILNKLSDKFGIKWKWDSSIEGLGKFAGNTVLINPNNFGVDTLFHEFAHPFIRAVKRMNPELYESFKQEVVRQNSILQQVKKHYVTKLSTEDQFIEEAMVTLVGIAASQINDVQKKNLGEKLLDLLNQFFREFARMIKLLSNSNDITVSKLKGMKLKELAGLMVLGDNKIIIPSAFTNKQAIVRIINHFNTNNGNIGKDIYDSVKKAVDNYNKGINRLALYMVKRPSGYAILSNNVNLGELEQNGIIKKQCK